MTPTEQELRSCLERLVDRVGSSFLQTTSPNLYKRIQTVLAKTEVGE